MGHENGPSATPDDAGGQGLDRARIDDSVQQAFAPEPMVWGPGADGLPLPEVRGHLPLAPALRPETFVCLADTSEFVMRDRWGEVVARFRPQVVRRAAGGDYYVSVTDALESHAPFLSICRRMDVVRGRVRVEPLRPQCRYLAQQMTDFQDASEHQMVERLCTARRDDESFFVGLRDTQLHACELREPRDQASLDRIEQFNRTKIALGRERVKETGEEFDVDKALGDAEARADKEGLTASGIFGDRR